jgi:hypothetical protein
MGADFRVLHASGPPSFEQAYGSWRDVRGPRRCVFIGTINGDSCSKSKTGRPPLWPSRLGQRWRDRNAVPARARTAPFALGLLDDTARPGVRPAVEVFGARRRVRFRRRSSRRPAGGSDEQEGADHRPGEEAGLARRHDGAPHVDGGGYHLGQRGTARRSFTFRPSSRRRSSCYDVRVNSAAVA